MRARKSTKEAYELHEAIGESNLSFLDGVQLLGLKLVANALKYQNKELIAFFKTLLVQCLSQSAPKLALLACSIALSSRLTYNKFDCATLLALLL